ncbi:hypothetical protein LEMA_P080990.1 [Plenodomus lingam JN3]|uniref:Mannosyl-oligosaccharide glucosidase n=1 Tax=Leptosphaeria maculans (strain JN3 / isolate v23.1.3 / race Av1-4-5-6-7-8) TaxID=985895 RepID=E5A5G2_LEPMJ|nr:hypothetical protein LEMA_P080990.1 [Plenodomus lingam JN3]CBX98860.1 hypothetical protein LEMA_P080990.1 [Plenodomus lingam JN3]
MNVNSMSWMAMAGMTNRIDITTEFIKFPGGEHGGSWGARIRGTLREDADPQQRTTVFWYNTLEGVGMLDAGTAAEGELGVSGDVFIKGETPDLGTFEVKVTEGQGRHPHSGHPSEHDKPLDLTLVHSGSVPENVLWQTKALIFKHIKGQIDQLVLKYDENDPPPPAQVYTIQHQPSTGNMHVVQKVFEGPFEFDIIFSSGSAPTKITSEDLTEQIGSVTSTFSSRFTEIFEPQPPFIKERYEEFSKLCCGSLLRPGLRRG